MALEEALLEAASKGLTHLTLYPVASNDGKTIYWHARATPSTGHSYVQTATLDPVESLAQVLQALPRASKRTTAISHREQAPELEVTEDVNAITATVIAPPDELASWLPKG
jgi:hypothetical protein